MVVEHAIGPSISTAKVDEDLAVPEHLQSFERQAKSWRTRWVADQRKLSENSCDLEVASSASTSANESDDDESRTELSTSCSESASDGGLSSPRDADGALELAPLPEALWTTRDNPMGVPEDCLGQLDAVVLAAMLAFRACSCVDTVTRYDADGKCSIIATVDRLPEVQLHLALAVVKMAVLQSVQQAASVRLVARDESPFVSMCSGLGFSVVLGWIKDESTNSLDLFSEYVCGYRCRAPSSQVTIEIFLEVD